MLCSFLVNVLSDAYTLDDECENETFKVDETKQEHNVKVCRTGGRHPGGAREGSGGVLPKSNLLDGGLRDVGGWRADPIVHVH